MSNIDMKSLKKLADTCRKAGIKTFKNAELEFTLTDEVPVSQYKKAKKSTEAKASVSNSSIESDSLTEEQLLFFSVVDPLSQETQ